MKKNLLGFSWCIVFFCVGVSGYSADALVATQGPSLYKVKNFSYLLGKIPGLPDELLKVHFKLYEGYVSNTNQLLSQIEECKKNSLDRSLTFGAFNSYC